MIGTNHCIEPPDAVFILDINGAIVLEINSCLPPTKSVDNASERRKVMRCEAQLRVPPQHTQSAFSVTDHILAGGSKPNENKGLAYILHGANTLEAKCEDVTPRHRCHLNNN